MTFADRDADVVVRIDTGLPDSLRIQISEGHREQMQSLLTGADIENSQAAEFSASDGTLELIAVTVLGGPAFWTALTKVVVAFINKNKDKSVRLAVGDKSIDASGYSSSEVGGMISALNESYGRKQAQWNWMKERAEVGKGAEDETG